MTQLTIELVPRTAWWSNVRNNVSRADWEKCKKVTRDQSGSRCEVCGGRGRKWPTEAHERWFYEQVKPESPPRHHCNDRTCMCPNHPDQVMWYSEATNEHACPYINCKTRTFGGWPGKQTLIGLIALCPDCHKVKHIGRSFAVGHGEQAIMHLSRVNQWNAAKCEAYIADAFRTWERRSQVEWKLDISYLSLLGIALPNQLDREKEFEPQ